jgi:OOP family OmpA-OmpF porin
MNAMQRVSLVLLFLTSLMASAQVEKNWNRFSIETGYGYVSPSKLYGNQFDKSDLSGFNHFDIGVRYMISEEIGLKLNYGRDSFSKDDAGVTFNSINISGVYNVGSLFNLNYATNERVGLLGRVGVGVTFAKPESISDNERIGTATIGLTPQVKLSERISLYGDLAYAFRFKQHYGFDGVLLNSDYTSEVGKTTVFSLGLMFYIGDKDRHADWY